MVLHRQATLQTIVVQSQGTALKYMQEMDAIPTESMKSAHRSYSPAPKKKKKKKKNK